MKRLLKVICSLSLCLVSPALLAAGPVNINKAGVWSLHHSLMDVTKQEAKEIVQYRKEHGPFTSKKDLLKVKGIGRANLNLNKNYIFTTTKSRASSES